MIRKPQSNLNPPITLITLITPITLSIPITLITPITPKISKNLQKIPQNLPYGLR
jgi:hypothetical protein